jgi:hypothetical protein
MTSCIVVAQFVTIAASLVVGHKADSWGRKPLFLVGFATLPVRGLLFAVVGVPAGLVSIQVLDGVGAGIFGALFPIMVADLTRGHRSLQSGARRRVRGLGDRRRTEQQRRRHDREDVCGHRIPVRLAAGLLASGLVEGQVGHSIGTMG